MLSPLLCNIKDNNSIKTESISYFITPCFYQSLRWLLKVIYTEFHQNALFYNL